MIFFYSLNGVIVPTHSAFNCPEPVELSHLEAQLITLRNAGANADAWTLMGDLLYKQGYGFLFKLNEQDAQAFGIKTLSATACYCIAIEINPQNPEYWWRLGTTCPQHETISIDGHSYNKRECNMRALSLNNKCAAAWCHLGETMNDDESIFIYHGKQKTQYYRSTCFLNAMAIAPQNPETWFMLASCMRERESLTLKGKLYNRLQCYIHILEMQRPSPAVQKKAWIALNQHLARNQSCTVNGVSYSKDECAFEALTCDDDCIVFDNIPPLPDKILQPEPPVATMQNSAPTIMRKATIPASSLNIQVAITPAPKPISEQQPKTTTKLNANASEFSPSSMPTSITTATRNAANNAPALSYASMSQLELEEIADIRSTIPNVVFIGFYATPLRNSTLTLDCPTCASAISLHEQWNYHVTTKSHLTKANESIAMHLDTARNEGRAITQVHYCCTVCHAIISGNKNLSLHIEGLRHKRRRELASISPCCDYIFCDRNELIAHFDNCAQGKQQMSVEKALAGSKKLSKNESPIPVAILPSSQSYSAIPPIVSEHNGSAIKKKPVSPPSPEDNAKKEVVVYPAPVARPPSAQTAQGIAPPPPSYQARSFLPAAPILAPVFSDAPTIWNPTNGQQW
jgi:hypothetical protein